MPVKNGQKKYDKTCLEIEGCEKMSAVDWKRRTCGNIEWKEKEAKKEKQHDLSRTRGCSSEISDTLVAPSHEVHQIAVCEIKRELNDLKTELEKKAEDTTVFINICKL